MSNVSSVAALTDRLRAGHFATRSSTTVMRPGRPSPRSSWSPARTRSAGYAARCGRPVQHPVPLPPLATAPRAAVNQDPSPRDRVILTSSALPARLTTGVPDQDQIYRCSDSPPGQRHRVNFNSVGPGQPSERGRSIRCCGSQDHLAHTPPENTGVAEGIAVRQEGSG